MDRFRVARYFGAGFETLFEISSFAYSLLYLFFLFVLIYT